jgi:hypothetical protein
MSFYVTLPSNSSKSLKLFPDNSMTDFTIQLASSLNFDVPYEVALVEMSYRHAWYVPVGKLFIDLKGDNNYDTINLKMFDGEGVDKFITRLNSDIKDYYIRKFYNERYEIGQKILQGEKIDNKLQLPLTQYDVENIYLRDSDVINEISDSLQLKTTPKFSYINRRILVVSAFNAGAKFTGNICKILNVPPTWLVGLNKTYTSGEIFDEQPAITQVLYVYTDIIDYQLVGDYYSPLLRNIVVDSEFLKTVWAHYDNPHYVKLNKTEINQINISIKDDNEDSIKFKDGKVVIKLHFRPIKYAY